MKLNARWSVNHPPVTGHWLKAPRGRTAYEIIGVRHRDKQTARGHNFTLIVVRHSPSEIPPGAMVHDWFWDKRNTKRTKR